ncbi:periodic tryptophan protein [Suhomyces tanzawaensis NRRL Y-17324]|uniref:Periodic tryptophan protein n=1 Tax=Suhomyces tanzawaensis NRRL Y-17324 TaxID=984487 RepID=A0A1E4SFB7_9ASCO|nr:periodic tryptophan protein [Suhomyces tanzawaensis NRRL Y-17324]ODV78183.1 periodic tryptophan protein [Suhomyces tanzawaensis NRRL Y-17324]
MKTDFKLLNLLGTVYRQGNLVYSEGGTRLLSPVGNRVTSFDLVNNRSFTYNYEHRRNIVRIALNRQGTLMITVDETGRAILVNAVARTVLHHFNFLDTVQDISFSPDGQYFAIACGRFVQVWKTPDVGEDRQFAPFVRHRVYAGHFADVTSVTWSEDSRFFISTSKDMTSRIFSLHSDEKDVAMTLAGHRDYVIKAFFNDTQEIIYTLSKDGALFRWEYTAKPAEDEDEEMDEDEDERPMSWRITAKNFFHADTKVKCADFHAKSNMLVVGFYNGEFRLYELPEFTMIQQLSMGQNAVDTVSINESGEWLAFGSGRLGQLLVYEWQSESYVLKQQGYFDRPNALCYSPDGSRLVTASDDGKIKVWDVSSGFCLCTFSEHQGAVTGVQFAKRGQVLFSSSMDGTVRAWDMIRFRNFRTFTADKRLQFNTLAVDPSGEVVVAGSQDSFEIYVWSVQTAQLLDSLTGHEGPVSCLAFGSENSVLASASWDSTVRVWNIFGRTQTVEPIEVTSDVLSLAMRPDSKELAVSTLDGHVAIYDVEDARQLHLIDGRKDIRAGRYLEDRFASSNAARSKHFTTVSYSRDGTALVAAGNNNTICMYDVANEVLVKRFTVSQNLTLDGTQQMLNSSKITSAGTSIDAVDRDGENLDREDREDLALPGSQRGDPLVRSVRAAVGVTAVEFSPTLAAFAAATVSEGLLIFSIAQDVVFDPFDLDVDITPAATVEVLREQEYLTALVMAFRLNERWLVQKVYEAVPLGDVQLVCTSLPQVYVQRLLLYIGESLVRDDSAHMEYHLVWVRRLLAAHGRYISDHKQEFGCLKLIQRFLSRVGKDVVSVGRRNGHVLRYLEGVEAEEGEEEDEEEVDEDEDEDLDADDSDEGEWIAPKKNQAPF